MIKYLLYCFVLISLFEIGICYAQGTSLTKPKVIVAPTKPTLEIDKIKDLRSDVLTERFNKTSFEFSQDKPKVIELL